MNKSTPRVPISASFPWGMPGRLTALALAMVLFTLEYLADPDEFAGIEAILTRALSFLPLAALSIGALPAAITWLLCLGGLIAQDMPPIVLGAMVIPSMLVVAGYCFLLPSRLGLGFSLGSIGALLAGYLLVPGTPLGLVVVNCVLMLLGALAGLALNAFQRRHDSNTVRIRTLEAEQARIRSDERTLLAHELHDIVAHDVTVIAMQARRAEFIKDPRKTSEILEGIGNSAQQTLQDLRSLVLLLKEESADQKNPVETDESSPSIIDPSELSGETTTAVGLVHDLESVSAALDRAGFASNLSVEGQISQVPASLRQALRRTVRELGTNILKHAVPESNVDIALQVAEDKAVLSSSNKIARGYPIMSSQTGLEAIRARCAVFGGSLEVGALEDSWRIRVVMPLGGLSNAD